MGLGRYQVSKKWGLLPSPYKNGGTHENNGNKREMFTLQSIKASFHSICTIRDQIRMLELKPKQ